jgi:hypothetical protein
VRLIIASLIPIVALMAVGWIWFGRRPTADQFAVAQGVTLDAATLPPVQVALRRTYAGRVLGALLGVVVLGGLGLIVNVGVGVGAACIGLVGGTMVGIALAQHRGRPAAGTVRRASLDARAVGDYGPARAPWSVGATAVAVLGATALALTTAAAGLGPYGAAFGLAVGTLVIIPVGRWLQRRIVEAPRDAIDPDVDDALRSVAVRAVHHSVLGVLLCGLAAACLGGVLTQSTWTVVSGGETVFTAPPGMTSISVDTGLRQAFGPGAPIRVYWIESDGSEHHTGPLDVAGTPRTVSPNLGRVGQLLGWLMLFAAVAALVQWSRAATAARRRPRDDRMRRARAGSPAGSPA